MWYKQQMMQGNYLNKLNSMYKTEQGQPMSKPHGKNFDQHTKLKGDYQYVTSPPQKEAKEYQKASPSKNDYDLTSGVNKVLTGQTEA